NADVSNPNADTIAFAITGSSPFIISLTTALQPITHPVVLDATTQGAGVEINGNGLSGDGLTLGTGSGGSTVKGLHIVKFAGAGIEIQSASNSVQGNTLGLDLTGTAGGNTNGVRIDNAANNTIGGTTTGAANTIASNTNDGVLVNGNTS